MDVYLDSSFIISSLKKRIDFLTELRLKNFKPLILSKVIEELEVLRDESVADKDHPYYSLALDLIYSEKLDIVDLSGKNTDSILIKLGKSGNYIATLDNEILKNIKFSISLDSSKKNVLINC